MIKKVLFLLSVSFTIFSQAQAPAGYYSSAQGLSGYALKSELSTIITNGHNAQSYGDLWTVYYTSDIDDYYEQDGTILDIYSEDPSGNDPYNFTVGNDQCSGSNGGEGYCYNREHSFPKSWFNDASPMVTDMHHIFPTDAKVNGERGNFPYGEVSNPSFTSQNGTKKGNNSYNHPSAYNGTVFEPIDEFKGDLARVYFYMATRYESQIAGWENSNAGSDATLNGTSNQVFEDWMLAMLLEWHYADPVSEKEEDRNDAAYLFQGNRNPYVDNEAWVTTIWDANPDTQAPSAPTNLVATSITTNSLELSWNASTDNVAVLNYQIEQDGNLIETNNATQTTVNNLTPNTNYSFQVFAVDPSGNISSGSNTLNVTTLSTENILIDEDFNDCNTIQFTAVSELSDSDWECLTQYGENNSGAYQMNSYSQGQQNPSIDWLITTNAINFDDYKDEILSFYTVATYGNSALELRYSTDYDGGNSPSNFTWTSVPNVTIPLHSNGGSNQEVYEFSNIDISSISGEVYIAFKYDTSNGEQATRWTVDSFKIFGEESLSVGNNELNSFSIFPNPATTEINIQVENTPNFSYRIYNLTGKIIQENNNKNTEKISVADLSSGLYLLQLTSNGKTATKKLIIQ
ncbi:endonuclease [Mesonia maritima]|uniref:Endonuclease I/chitodextrinase n=1 Tax=Mesonia maritima TaxID=1793873 RepID=A0ABU1K5A8_9FLAO|nr:endonuclease [Mesonia maritima]MDR6300800.1 endonuclease I/chitodextrinase [Mesonia maritima]